MKSFTLFVRRKIMNTKKCEKNIFLCSFCGLIIQSNLENLKKHEQLHQPILKKIKCAEKNCKKTFQSKSNYYAHWQRVHPNLVMPGKLIYINEENKTMKIRARKIQPAVGSKKSVLAESNVICIDCTIKQCLIREPFFGKLI